MLGLHLRQSAQVGGGYRVEVPVEVRDVLLGRRGPLLQVGQDFGVLVVKRADQAMRAASALEPHLTVALGEPPGEPFGLRDEWRTVGAERGDVPVDAISPEVHPGNTRHQNPS